MRINSRHVCKNCCYFIPDDNGYDGCCCLDPLFVQVKAFKSACKHYGSDDDDDNIDYSTFFTPTDKDEDFDN